MYMCVCISWVMFASAKVWSYLGSETCQRLGLPQQAAGALRGGVRKAAVSPGVSDVGAHARNRRLDPSLGLEQAAVVA